LRCRAVLLAGSSEGISFRAYNKGVEETVSSNGSDWLHENINLFGFLLTYQYL
jgi:hypothetical protein